MSQAPSSIASPDDNAPLKGYQLWLAVLMLTSANFIAVLNLTIANVAVPNIAGNLGAATSQGTWVITAYAVGEAITVPLTGWLSARFGAVRVFVGSMAAFGIFSALCGWSNSIGLLVIARVFQGFSGGPLMPLSQTLLMRIFPKEKAAMAIGLWSMTTIVAPIVGPILGGWLCDEHSWSWVFLINLPIAVAGAFFAWQLLKRFTERLSHNSIDVVGLILLVIWVAALQIMLDEGKDLDWFASSKIIVLAIIAVIGFAAFMIWEMTAKNPVVDMRVFRHRGFSASVLTISLAYAAFFGFNVLVPLWLQSFMGYTATIAGMAVAWSGVAGFLMTPIAAQLGTKVDARRLVFGGVVWMGLTVLWCAGFTTDMGFWDVALPMLVFGFGIPFFFVPTTGLALASVEEHEMDSAAGLMNFLRTLSGAFATSMVTTAWSDRITINHAELVGLADRDQSVQFMLESSGAAADTVKEIIDYLVTGQSVMLATNQMMAILGIALVVAAFVIWLAPRPTRVVEPGTGGH